MKITAAKIDHTLGQIGRAAFLKVVENGNNFDVSQCTIYVTEETAPDVTVEQFNHCLKNFGNRYLFQVVSV